LSTQAKLIESMSRGDIQPLGARHRFRVDVRVIAASDICLKDAIAREEFREDLYYSLATVYLQLPPLRDRTGDIPALVRHFLGHIGDQPGMRPLSITDDALNLLKTYDWPGNVRQLQNALFRAAIYCEGDALTRAEFPQLAALVGELDRQERQANEGVGVMLYTPDGNLRPLEEIEADVIRLAIGHYRGRMTEVARRLGIGRSTLYRKLSELGIDNAA
jgi:DNA-binding NtrC family response regulator